jgi:trimethylamine:corrinoid methyltransferase-like protein
LTIDAEAIGMIQHMLKGITVRTETLATAMFEGINFKADFLKQRITRELFATEQYLPSSIIDRDSLRGWMESGSLNTFDRAKIRTNDLVSKYQRPESALAHEKELTEMMASLARNAGMDKLPELA